MHTLIQSFPATNFCTIVVPMVVCRSEVSGAGNAVEERNAVYGEEDMLELEHIIG